MGTAITRMTLLSDYSFTPKTTSVKVLHAGLPRFLAISLDSGKYLAYNENIIRYSLIDY